MNISPINTALSAVASAPSPSSLAGQVGIKMLDNALESSEAENAGLVKMMELSVNPELGGNFDARV